MKMWSKKIFDLTNETLQLKHEHWGYIPEVQARYLAELLRALAFCKTDLDKTKEIEKILKRYEGNDDEL